MADDDKDQRTEEATDKRKRDAREKGQSPKSREITSVFVMFSSMMVFYYYGTYMFKRFMHMTASSFVSLKPMDLTVNAIHVIFQASVIEFFMIVAPVMITAFLIAFLSNVAQTGGIVFAPDKLALNFSKLDPIKGIGKLLSLQSLAELVKSISKIAIVGYVAYVTVSGEFLNLPLLSSKSMGQVLVYIGGVSFKIFLRSLVVLFIMSAMDFVFQRYEFNKSLKMTKQAIKDEQKDAEGDPMIKSRIRGIQREMSRRRMMEEVPKADVVITNPTRLAIAVKYDRDSMSAPRIVAKGAGHLAKKMRELAKENSVPLVENKPVARALFKSVKIGQEVPEALYKAIAEILAYVYKLKGNNVTNN